MKHNDDHTLDPLFAEARGHHPFGEPVDFGFETRLRAALGASGPGFAECLASLSWRFSAAFLPLILAAFVFLAMRHHHALPDGVGGIVSQWAGLLPLPI